MSPNAKEVMDLVNEDTPLLQQGDDDTSLFSNKFPNEKEGLRTRTKREISEQMTTALPTLQSMVLTKIPWFISLRFVGGIGANELAAAALATTICNVTGLSFSVGLSSALSTLSSQAKGELLMRSTRQQDEEDNIKERRDECNNREPLTPMVYLFRGLLIQLAIVIPIGVWWIIGTEKTLLSLGQQDFIASMTESYLRVLAPGLWGYSISWTLTAWVQSIGMADVPVYAAILGLILHVPFNWLFIYHLGLGYLGCALATVVFQCIQPIFIISFLFLSQNGRKRLLESSGGHAIGRSRLTFLKEFSLAASSLNGFFQYMSLALPGMVIISEWWASELSIFLSGRLEPSPEAALGGMTIYQSINTFCFMFPVAFSVSASTRVGNLLGADKPKEASFAAKVSIGCASMLSFILGSLLLRIPHTFLPSLFAPDEEQVVFETSRVIPLLAVYVFADGIQVALNGIIKGCGRQCVITPIVLFAYWVVAIPTAYYIVFIRHDRAMSCDDSYFCGNVGLVAAMTSGTCVHMILLAIVVGLTTDWNLEAIKAKERVSRKQ